MNNKCNKTDVVINFKDMFMHICLRWRSIIVIVLAFTVLATGYKFYSDYSNYTATVKKSNTEIAQPAKDDINADYTAAVNAVNLRNCYINRYEYVQNSPLMEIDSNAAPTYSATYAINGANGATVANLHKASVLNTDSLVLLLQSAEVDIAAEYLGELISITNNSFDADGSQTVSGFTVKILAPNDEALAALADAVKSRISENHSSIKAAIGDYSLKCTEEAYFTRYDADLIAKQTDITNKYRDALKEFNTAYDALSGKALEYYNVLTDADYAENPPAPSISKKYMLLGFAGGLVVAVLLYAATYLFGSKLKSLEDASMRYDIYFAGALKTQGKKKWLSFIDNFIKKAFDKRFYSKSNSELSAVISERLELEANKLGCKTVYVTGTSLTEADRNALSSALCLDGIQLTNLDSVIDNPKSLAALCGCVIIAEKANSALYADIYSELELLNRNSIDVLGAIVLC